MRHLLDHRFGVSYAGRFAVALAFASHAFLHAQTIADISPKTGPASTAITITGSGFGNTQGTVTFGGAPAPAIRSWTDTQIVVLPFDLKAPVNAGLDVVVAHATTHKQSNAKLFLETMPPIMPASGPAGVTIKINGNGFGSTKGARSAVSINDQPVNLAAGTDWSDTALSVVVPDAGAHMSVYLKVLVTDSDGNTHDVGEFKETPPAAPQQPGDLTLSPASGYGGASVKITGKGFGNKQEAQVLKFDGQTLPVAPSDWKDGEIDVKLPPFGAPPSDTPVDLRIEDGFQHALFKAQFTKLPAKATLSAKRGVAGDPVTIGGSGFPDLTKDKNAKVLFDDTEATVRPISATDSTPDAGPNAITVSVPNLGVPPNGKSVTVKVADGTGVVVAQANQRFKAEREMWGDRDETPLDIKFVAGYEQGYLSSQNSNNDAFLAIYGRKIFGKDLHSLGPYFAIRLLTAPQTGENYNVTSVFTNPAGQIKTTDFNTVGSAVDFTGGLEWPFKKFTQGRTTLSAVFGGGFTTPTDANTIAQSYVMPGYGTVECNELQSRLTAAGILGKPAYSNIVANKTSANGACFSNTAVTDTTTNLPTAIKFLNYAAPDSLNFYAKYSGGLRLINRWPGKIGGPRHCTEADPCERGYVDFLLGQNANLTGGKLQHTVLAIDSTYPMPVPGLNYLYLFGTFSKRLGNLPPNLDPLVLKSGLSSGGSGSSPPASPDPSILVVPLAQPDSDFYRFGAGINVVKVFTALTGQSKQQ